MQKNIKEKETSVLITVPNNIYHEYTNLLKKEGFSRMHYNKTLFLSAIQDQIKKLKNK